MTKMPAPGHFDLSRFVFLDTETTGLLPYCHDILELGYAVGEEQPIALYPVFPVNGTSGMIRNADPKALEVNRWLERFPDGAPTSTYKEWDTFWETVKGKTLVGANVRFDVQMLMHTEHIPEPWHHRLLDLLPYAAGVLAYPVADKGLPGLSTLAKILSDEYGYEIPKPDHTAVGDVLASREILIALFDIIEQMNRLAALLTEEEKPPQGYSSPLPIHRTEANTGGLVCSTCDGGGCPDCTDPA